MMLVAWTCLWSGIIRAAFRLLEFNRDDKHARPQEEDLVLQKFRRNAISITCYVGVVAVRYNNCRRSLYPLHSSDV